MKAVPVKSGKPTADETSEEEKNGKPTADETSEEESELEEEPKVQFSTLSYDVH